MTKAYKYGILGTIIFHLLLAIFLLGKEIAELRTMSEMEIEFDNLSESELVEKLQQMEDLRQSATQKEVEDLLRSVAVNQETQQQDKSAEDLKRFIEEVRDELNDEGGYGDRYKSKRDKNFTKDSLQHERDKLERQLDSLKSTFYSGESSVSYKLEGRYAKYLPIPIFRCEFGGKVVVQMFVDRDGKVQKANVIESLSAQDDCLREVAEKSVLKSMFNAKVDAPSIQKGEVTYIFVKQ